jgi:uncharacterized protein (DUF433 family)
MATIRGMQGRSETLIQNFSREVWREETTAEIKGDLDDITKTDVKEIQFEYVNWCHVAFL